jgi:hypothetical protein
MSRTLARLVAVLFVTVLSLRSLLALPQQDRSLATIGDAQIQQELQELGLYPELVERLPASSLQDIPFRSSSPQHVEFFGDGIRLRIETHLFDHASWVQRKRTGFFLEHAPVVGWTPGDQHSRLSRVELIMDGTVVELPLDAFTDLFDLPLCSADGSVRFARVCRSRDGWRTYVHVQAGEDEHIALVTWVFEDGRYLYRVVDRITG